MSESSFDQELEDSRVPWTADFSAPRPVLLMAFGGRAGGLAVPPFEFFKLAQTFQVRKLFLRDLNQAWYLKGLPGIGGDVQELAAFLKKKVAESGAEKVVITGNSMGGFAAILFGALLKAAGVHAFGPQTFLDRFNRLRYWDCRWATAIRRARGNPAAKPYLDLKRWLGDQGPWPGKIHLYYSLSHRLDRVHAERLRGIPGIGLEGFPEGGHELARILRDGGKLRQILAGALDEAVS